MKKRRNIEAFSLSFLDCICCGFGAIVLLLVLSKLHDPSSYDLSNQSQELSQSLKQQLIAISNETEQTENELRSFDELIKNKYSTIKILDIGTGSGALAISLAREFINANIKAIDISEEAIKVANVNINNKKLNNQIQLRKTTLDNINEKFDLIVSNPP